MTLHPEHCQTLPPSLLSPMLVLRINVATSILHIYSHDKPVIKMIHRAVNIITTAAKLFPI